MTTAINNKLMKIGNYFIKNLLLHYFENNEGCELQTKRNSIEFIIKEVAKYYMENIEEFFKFLDIFYTNETTKKMCEEFLKEEEEFEKCLKEFFKCLEKIFFLFK